MKFVKECEPDMMVVQETKCGMKEIPSEVKNLKGYHTYWQDSGDKKGYAGVGLLSKNKPISVTFGMDVPNSGRGLVRLKYRQEWDSDFMKYINDLDKKKPVVYCGDLNVAHNEIDLKNPKSNTKNAGFTKEERADFTELLKEGYIDSFRHLNPTKTGAYSFWSYMGNARAKNVGWRLDYFVLSERLKSSLCDSVIQPEYMGSDHCPITLTLAL